jgi:hypothetical protein
LWPVSKSIFNFSIVTFLLCRWWFSTDRCGVDRRAFWLLPVNKLRNTPAALAV